MQWVLSRIWTRVAVFISYDYNNYTTGTSLRCTIVTTTCKLGIPLGLVANVLVFDTIVTEFQNLSRWYVHFRNNIVEKYLNTMIPHAMA